MKIGTIQEIWRYPVKSMAGEKCDATKLGSLGVPGDRGWAVRDMVRGGIRGAKKLPGLMQCSARYLEEPGDDPLALPVAEFRIPGGEPLRADATDAAAKLGAFLGTTVTLWPRRPASDHDHYRRGAPDHADLETELRAVFAREPDEPLPDLSVFPPEIFEFESPLGTYFDAFPLLLVTDASLRTLERLAPGSRADLRRFRPNLVVAASESEAKRSPFPEAAWAGKEVRVGGATLEITVACPRCVMITLPFADLPKDPALLRAVVREAGQNLGVYAKVKVAGEVRPGDSLVVEG
jgi:uncharacterized protein YcbX